MPIVVITMEDSTPNLPNNLASASLVIADPVVLAVSTPARPACVSISIISKVSFNQFDPDSGIRHTSQTLRRSGGLKRSTVSNESGITL
jgi:hypothetical protein